MYGDTMLKPSIFMCLTLCWMMIGSTFCIDDQLCGPLDDPSVKSKIFLVVFKSDNSRWVTPNLLETTKILEDHVDPQKGTVLYIHGWTENSASTTVQKVTSAYLQRGDVNVLVLDWGNIAVSVDYLSISRQVPSVGKATADVLMSHSNIIDLSRVSIVGHSLGAHVGGYIARNMNTTIRHLSGLDPAFPKFYPSSCHIMPTDALDVSILHTNGGVYGTPFNTGTTDFYANFGIGIQPNCSVPLNLCSHQRSVDIFAQSVLDPLAFPAKPCVDGVITDNSDDQTVYYNDQVDPNIRGTYCFRTNETLI